MPSGGEGLSAVKKLRSLLITCEHGGNSIPEMYRSKFTGNRNILNSHRGYDIGALDAARDLAHETGGIFLHYDNTRLLIDMNRSEWSRGLFSPEEFSLTEHDRERVLAELYRPYRKKVAHTVAGIIRKSGRAVHFAVHSFTPVLHGMERNADIGFLYDPARRGEKEFCGALRNYITAAHRTYRVRMNYPYRGTADGLTTSLRKFFPDDNYIGIECELNQHLTGSSARRMAAVMHLAGALYRLF